MYARGITICLSKAEFLIALGGGSVIDAAKYISATAFSGASAWDYVILASRKEREYAGAKPERCAKLARRVFGVRESNDVFAARALCREVIGWFKGIGMYLKLSDVAIGEEKIEVMTDDIIRMYGTIEGNKVPGPRPMDRSDIVEIFRRAR